jgi:magnesium transporter
LFKKLNQLNKPIIDYISSSCSIAEYSQEIKDQHLNLDTITDELLDNTNNHVSLFLSVSSYRTNEVMRVLTVFSVFFMPLSFLVGVYGMNFSNMPELNTHYGYFVLWVFLLTITAIIYFWFRRRKWL